MANVKAVTAADFQKNVIEVAGVSIVDFWAPWCSHCQHMMPIFESLSDELSGKANFAKVNTDDEMELARQYAIEVLPTFLVIKNGQVVDRKIGDLTPEDLKAMLVNQL